MAIKKVPRKGKDKEGENADEIIEDAEDEIIKTLMGENVVDYVVKPRFLQQKRDEKRGSDFRKKTKIDADLAAQPLEEAKDGKTKKKKKSKKGISFGDTVEVAVINDEGGVDKLEDGKTTGMLKHRKKSKKKGAPDEQEMAEKAQKRAKTMADVTKAMRKRTLETRARVIEKQDAKEERAKETGKKKPSSRKDDTGEKWDWEDAVETKELADIKEDQATEDEYMTM